MTAALIVDETTHGYRKEYEDVPKLKEDVNTLIDERVMKIEIVKSAPEKEALCEYGSCKNKTATTRFDVLREIKKEETFADLIMGFVQEYRTPEAIVEVLKKELTEEELQTIMPVALSD